jgi:hypothetical protein
MVMFRVLRGDFGKFWIFIFGVILAKGAVGNLLKNRIFKIE